MSISIYCHNFDLVDNFDLVCHNFDLIVNFDLVCHNFDLVDSFDLVCHNYLIWQFQLCQFRVSMTILTHFFLSVSISTFYAINLIYKSLILFNVAQMGFHRPVPHRCRTCRFQRKNAHAPDGLWRRIRIRAVGTPPWPHWCPSSHCRRSPSAAARPDPSAPPHGPRPPPARPPDAPEHTLHVTHGSNMSLIR